MGALQIDLDTILAQARAFLAAKGNDMFSTPGNHVLWARERDVVVSQTTRGQGDQREEEFSIFYLGQTVFRESFRAGVYRSLGGIILMDGMRESPAYSHMLETLSSGAKMPLDPLPTRALTPLGEQSD